MTTLSTKERILNSTEKLIAEHGFAELSIRKISLQAHTNLAAINYHFGNKQQLINQVLERRLNNLFEVRMKMLHDLNQGDRKITCNLEQILHAFIAPALYMINDEHQGGKVFMKVLARAYAEQSDSLHDLLAKRYTPIIKEFAEAIQLACPDLPRETIFWRFHFIIGALTYAMGDFGASSMAKQMPEAEYFNKSVQELIQFAVAALTT
ncbi:TetR/AcrR family transcriptional regulator [Marinicella meishanensis]|uniref:TetR/AcrR family transcriptional regulator n=1 Tax=Marinicella meishanensis TaxID=2873263 RepID=UPI001CBB8503|nr:TetR/AcrR family transcriptional regulator [Marinicella sp. NBU2979]